MSKTLRIDNLYLNTRHDTLAWTHANGSVKAISDIVQGKCLKLTLTLLGLISFLSKICYSFGKIILSVEPLPTLD